MLVRADLNSSNIRYRGLDLVAIAVIAYPFDCCCNFHLVLSPFDCQTFVVGVVADCCCRHFDTFAAVAVAVSVVAVVSAVVLVAVAVVSSLAVWN